MTTPEAGLVEAGLAESYDAVAARLCTYVTVLTFKQQQLLNY